MKTFCRSLLLAFVVSCIAITTALAQTTIIRLGGATRFTVPVHSITEVQAASTFAYRRDVEIVLDRAGLTSIADKVNGAIHSGNITPTFLSKGATFEWMARRNKGVVEVLFNLKWDGGSLLGYTFSVTEKGTKYTFFIPEVCGNLSLIKHEAVATPQTTAPSAPVVIVQPAPPPIVKEVPVPVQVPLYVLVYPPEVPRPDYHYFVSGMVGKQQRNYDEHFGPQAGTVKMAGDVVASGKAGVSIYLTPHWILSPSVGATFNAEVMTRSSAFADGVIQYRLDQGTAFGFGVTGSDNLYHDNRDFRLGYLGSVTIPFPKESKYKHLSAVAEWCEYTKPLYGRYTNPSANYQFWGGLQVNW